MTIRQLIKKFKEDIYIILNANGYNNSHMRKTKFLKTHKNLLNEKSFELSIKMLTGECVLEINIIREDL